MVAKNKKANVKKFKDRPTYKASDWGETDLCQVFSQQRDEARTYFLSQIKPRLDRSYKLYIAWPGDRAKEIQRWQSNVSIPYVQGVIETMVPRIIDARPDFSVQGRNKDSQARASKLEGLCNFYWEKAEMDSKVEMLVRAAMTYGTGYLQAYWRKDVRTLKFLQTDDLTKELTWKEKERTFYDAPTADWVDNYSLWYDWRNVEAKNKRFWFVRRVLTEGEITRRYPMADPDKLALLKPGGDISDYASIRQEVKATNTHISRGQEIFSGNFGTGNTYHGDDNSELFEVFEWWRPLDDLYSVMANEIPILKGGEIPNPYDFKETPFIDIPYLKVPGEFEGYGVPMILEYLQIMLNTIKNQRIDAVTLNIHKMWIVNPLANIDKAELVTRPFGIIYSPDPNGVREVQFSDVKESAFKEEDMLKNDMRYASGVDDASMGSGGQASSATEVRHLRESTIERVRLFVNHLGDGFANLQRYWIEMTRQFFTEDMTIRIVGNDGKVEFPLIEKDDLMGEFDFKSTVLPSIAGQNEVKKKQDMDLLQLLMQLPFIDPKKLVSKVLFDWNWDAESIMAEQQPGAPQPGQEQPQEDPKVSKSLSFKDLPPDGQVQLAAQAGIKLGQGAPQQGPSGTPPEAGGPMPGQPPSQPMPGGPPQGQGGPRDSVSQEQSGRINPAVVMEALRRLESEGGSPGQYGGPSSFAEFSRPIPPGVQSAQPPPTAPGIPLSQPGMTPFGNANQVGKTSNPRGFNRSGKVNTNISSGNNASPESSLLNRTFNLQK